MTDQTVRGFAEPALENSAGVGEKSRNARLLAAETRLDVTSVGIDIGSATSQILFSHIVLVKFGSRYIPVSTAVTYESPIVLTPYVDGDLIDTVRLRHFFDNEYLIAGMRPDDVDAGSLILTGTALRRRNSRAIGDLFAGQAGRLVAVSAGDALEAVLAAHGSGTVALSRARHERILDIDVGGGTTKLALCSNGTVEATTAIDVGSRLVVVSGDNRAGRTVVRLEDAGRLAAEAAGVDLGVGGVVTDEELGRIADVMVEQVLAACPVAGNEACNGSAPAFLRGPSMHQLPSVDTVTVSGGVAEYVYGRSAEALGDLGQLLADRLGRSLRQRGVELLDAPNGIRATVVGASQFAAQVSGNTIYLSSTSQLPIRNVPVIAVENTLEDDVDEDALAEALVRAAQKVGLQPPEGPVALALHWAGLATYERLSAVARGVAEGIYRLGGAVAPVVLVCDEDIGRLLGRRLDVELGGQRPVISIDCVELRSFDYVDIGEMVGGSGAVPVVIKSLHFGAAASPQEGGS